MVFSYPTRQFFLLLHIFMESWLEDGRQLNLLGEPRELITNPLDSLKTLRVWRNISMSRNHVRTMFVSPLLPLLCLAFSFRIFFSSSRVSFAANCQRKFLGGGHKKSRVYLPSMYTACPAQVLCINFKFTFMSCRAEYEIEYRLSYMSLWHESSLELIATSHRHPHRCRHPGTQFQCPKSKEKRKKLAYKTSDKKGKTCRIIAKCFSPCVPPSTFCLLHFTAIRVGHTFGSFSCPAVPGGILPFYVYVAEAKNRLWSVPQSSRPLPSSSPSSARLTVP